MRKTPPISTCERCGGTKWRTYEPGNSAGSSIGWQCAEATCGHFVHPPGYFEHVMSGGDDFSYVGNVSPFDTRITGPEDARKRAEEIMAAAEQALAQDPQVLEIVRLWASRTLESGWIQHDPPIDTVAAELGWTRDKARWYLTKVEERGWVVRVPKRRWSARYKARRRQWVAKGSHPVLRELRLGA